MAPQEKRPELASFLGWSGDHSRAVAQALHGWIPQVLNNVKPWYSQEEIGPGARWEAELDKSLAESNVGIMCITKENVGSPWVLYEAGALSKSSRFGRVICLLLDLDVKHLTGSPLAKFQAKKANKDGVFDIIKWLDEEANGDPPDDKTKRLFTALWPKLKQKLDAASKLPGSAKKEDLLSAGVQQLGFRRVLTQRELTQEYPLSSLVEKANLDIKVLALSLSRTRDHLKRIADRLGNAQAGEQSISVRMLVPDPAAHSLVRSITPLQSRLLPELAKTLILLHKVWSGLDEVKRAQFSVRLFKEPVPHYSVLILDGTAFLNLHCHIDRNDYRLSAICDEGSPAFRWVNSDFTRSWDNSNKRLDTERKWDTTLNAPNFGATSSSDARRS